MRALLEVIQQCYREFYIKNDENAWMLFSKIIEMIQTLIVDESIDLENKQILIDFVEKLPEIERYKQEGNYSLIADIFADFEMRAMNLKELN